MKNKMIYSINSSDLQYVALQEIDRELFLAEILKISDIVNRNIKWYDIVADSINEEVNSF